MIIKIKLSRRMKSSSAVSQPLVSTENKMKLLTLVRNSIEFLPTYGIVTGIWIAYIWRILTGDSSFNRYWIHKSFAFVLIFEYTTTHRYIQTCKVIIFSPSTIWVVVRAVNSTAFVLNARKKLLCNYHKISLNNVIRKLLLNWPWPVPNRWRP